MQMSLFILAMMKPSCPVTPLALEELENAVQLFKAASSRNYMAARSYVRVGFMDCYI